MKTKAQILARIKELEDEIDSIEMTSLGTMDGIRKNREILGKLRALNWVLNKD